MNQAHVKPLGWIIVLLGLYVVSKSRTGYHVLYFALVLILVFLLAANYQQVDALILEPGSSGQSSM
ncbi:MAG: hypothetical protein IRZ03_16455 [Acidobacterium ailaaui]|nr:hypothetical protein [Pseudacidobacterium ailaaui]